MKKAIAFLILVSALAWGQAPPPPPPAGSQVATPQPAPIAATNLVQRVQAPTYSDMYCAGFLTKKEPSAADFVVGGYNSPHTTHWGTHDYIYLAGSGYQEGQQLSMVRRLRNPQKFEMFKGQYSLMAATGQPYQELGRVRVVAIRGSYAVAFVEFSCDGIVPGDIAVPFTEKTMVPFRGNTTFDRFAPSNGKLTGRIVMAQDFDTIMATGHKVYLNVGADQGVQVGDYFRSVRTYSEVLKDQTESLSFHAVDSDDTQGNRYVAKGESVSGWPRIGTGEMIVIGVTPTSSTAMITFALEDVHLGDSVELEEGGAAPSK